MLPPPEMPPAPEAPPPNLATGRIMRKELYDRIWAESVAHVGPKLGLWPRRLSMLCEKNRIPMPNRAYWYRATADRKTIRTPLPDADQDWEITFVPSQPGPPKPPADETAAPRVVVPERLGRSHRLVQETREASKKASTDRGILILPSGCLDIRVSPASVGRACRIMHTLIRECERRGWTVRAPAKGWHRTIIKISDCDVGIHLLEGWRQEPRELSESEKKWEEEREWPRKRPPYDLKPNGRFTLRIGCREAVLYDHWRDGKLRRLEDMLASF